MRRDRARFLVATLILVGLAFAASAGGAETAKKTTTAAKKTPAKKTTAISPCNDKLFLQLRNKPSSEMTEKDRKYHDQKLKECTEYEVARARNRKLKAAAAKPSKPTAAKTAAPGKASTSATARASANGAAPAKATAPANAAGPANAAASGRAAATANPAANPPAASKPASGRAAASTEPARGKPASSQAAPGKVALPPAAHTQVAPARQTRHSAAVDNAEPQRRRFALAGHAGVAPPSGAMTDFHHNGWTFGAGLDYTLNDRFAIELISLGVDHFPLDKDWSATNTPPGGSITVVSMVSGLRGRLTRGHTGLFLAAGAGLFRAASWDVELATGETIEGKDQTALGWSLGGGIERRLSERATAFTEMRAIFATTAFDNSVYYPVRGGLRFDVW